MNMARKVSVITFFTILIFTVFHLDSGAKEYKYSTIVFPGAVSTDVFGINDSGQIVGDYNDGNKIHGFLYDRGKFAIIDYPGADLTSLLGINNRGQIVGRFLVNGDNTGFIYEKGNFTAINYPCQGEGEPEETELTAQTTAINDTGLIVGSACHLESFLYEEGTFKPIDGSTPRDINNHGQIVGENGNKFGFFEDRTTFSLIEYPGEVLRTEAAGINDSGTIVGYYSSDDLNVRHGFIYKGRTYSTINFPGAESTFLYDINNKGQIVANIKLYGKSIGALIVPTNSNSSQGDIVFPKQYPAAKIREIYETYMTFSRKN